jgi:hypothetical protein
VPSAPAAAAAPTPAPVALKPATAAPLDAKKATAKVEITPASPAKPAPQATVKIGPAIEAAAPAPQLKKSPDKPADVESGVAGGEDSLTGILAIAATVVALASFGIQIWMFL